MEETKKEIKIDSCMTVQQIENEIDAIWRLKLFCGQLVESLATKKEALQSAYNIPQEVCAEECTPSFANIIEPMTYTVISMHESDLYNEIKKLINSIS